MGLEGQIRLSASAEVIPETKPSFADNPDRAAPDGKAGEQPLSQVTPIRRCLCLDGV